MKTTEAPAAPAAPANLSTRELAATLTKTAPDQPTKKEAGSPEEPVVRETPEKPEGEEPESLTTDETIEEGEPPSPQPSPPGEGEEQPAEEAPDAPEETPAEEPKAALPAEVLEAIEIAKAQDGGKGKADLLKRVHKLVDARDTERNARLAAEEREKNLRGELQQARTAKPEVAVQNGVHPAVAKVQGELANVDHWMGVCEDVLPKLQSGEMEFAEFPDGKGGMVKAGAKDIQKTLRELQDIRQETVAKKIATERDVKQAFDAKYAESHATAIKRFPGLASVTSPESVQLQKIVTAFPALKQFPDYEVAIGHMLRSMALDQKATADAKTKGAVKKPVASREPTRVSVEPPGGGADPDETGEKAAKQSDSQFKKTGSVKDLAKSLTARRQVSRTGKR